MNRAEWEAAFQYLLGRLRESEGMSEVAAEIERVSERMVVVPAQEVPSEWRLSKRDRSEMGDFSVRPRTPEERFMLALQLLEARAVEHPAVVRRLQKRLDVQGKTIRFAPDDTSEVESGEDFVGELTAGLPEVSDMREVRQAFQRLRDLADEEKGEPRGVSPGP
jgi:hypothetical protein